MYLCFSVHVQLHENTRMRAPCLASRAEEHLARLLLVMEEAEELPVQRFSNAVDREGRARLPRRAVRFRIHQHQRQAPGTFALEMPHNLAVMGARHSCRVEIDHSAYSMYPPDHQTYSTVHMCVTDMHTACDYQSDGHPCQVEIQRSSSGKQMMMMANSM